LPDAFAVIFPQWQRFHFLICLRNGFAMRNRLDDTGVNDYRRK
jgi:hypothetical protein